TAPPSSGRSTACTPLPRTRRTRPPAAVPAAGRRRRVPASAAAPPTSPSGRPEPPQPTPSPSPITLPKRTQPQRISTSRLRQRAAKALHAGKLGKVRLARHAGREHELLRPERDRLAVPLDDEGPFLGLVVVGRMSADR